MDKIAISPVSIEPSDRDLRTRTGYDVAGRKVQAIDAAGRVTQFAYDNLDRLTGVTENMLTSGCTSARSDCNVTTQYQYDRAGNRTVLQCRAGQRPALQL